MAGHEQCNCAARGYKQAVKGTSTGTVAIVNVEGSRGIVNRKRCWTGGKALSQPYVHYQRAAMMSLPSGQHDLIDGILTVLKQDEHRS